MKLFRNLIKWWANKQIIIIISIIEAELMILLQMTYEEIYIQWMLEELNIKLNHDNVIIQCDNQQMLCLVRAEIEYQWGCITVCYIESKSMIINSLMKVLSLNSHCQFLDQMNLIDIQDCLLDHWIQEAAAFKSSELMNINWIEFYVNCQCLNVMRNFESEQDSTANFDVNFLSWIELFCLILILFDFILI